MRGSFISNSCARVLARAVEKVAIWDPSLRFNDTTRHYFEKPATRNQRPGAAPSCLAVVMAAIRLGLSSSVPRP